MCVFGPCLPTNVGCSRHSALQCNSSHNNAVVFSLCLPGVEYGSMLLILLISLTFALISPLITIFGAVFCGGMWVYWRWVTNDGEVVAAWMVQGGCKSGDQEMWQ